MGQILDHAGGKLDVEVFDGEFAADETGEEAIADFLKDFLSGAENS